MKKSVFFVILFSAVLAFTSIASEKNDGSIQSKMDNIMQWEEKFGFSGSVLVVKDDEVILSKGYGLANKQSVFPNTPQTAFYIASISKPITALAVIKLVEGKQINLQDPITKYFPNVPEDKRTITIEMLLTHTSGFEHTYLCDNITDRDKAIETTLNETPMVAAPGEEYNYSGDNYTLLAAIIEIVSGYKFETFVTEKILKSAGIETPAFAGNLQLLKDDDIASPSPNSHFKSIKEIESTWGRKGRAGIILSVEDLYKLDAALIENELFKKNITDDILSPKIKNNRGSNYGYGFNIENTIRGTKVFGHDGDDDGIGHNAVYLDFPDEKVKIFIASNSGLYSETSWSGVISSLLQKVLFESEYTYPSDELYYNEFGKLQTDKLEKYEGVYQSGNTSYHVWLNNDKQLFISPVGNDVAKTFGYSDAYIKNNDLTKSILEETHDQKFDALQSNSIDNVSFEKMKKAISGFWQSVEKKNGPLDKIEILGTANIWGGNYQSEIATWFKLVFEDKSQIYRLEWNANNKISGLGGSRIPYPMMFIMNPIAEKEFLGFDPANGRTMAVNFLSFDKNKTMEVNIGNNKSLILQNSGNLNMLPKRSAAQLLYDIINTKGIDAAEEEFSEIKERKLERFDIDEGELNEIGYALLNERKMNEAIAVFTIIVQEFPESANAFDSLGEVYMKAGNKPEAIKNYEKSLELDAENTNAKKMIEEMSK